MSKPLYEDVKKEEVISDYWRTVCGNCRHVRRDHDCGERDYCNLNICDCDRFIESAIVATSDRVVKNFGTR